MATDRLNQQQFIQEIQRLCASGETGTLVGITASGPLTTMTLQDGTIIALSFHISAGNDALAQLRTMGESKVSFQPGVLLHAPQPDLPSTDEILLSLGVNPEDAESIINAAGSSFTQQELQKLIEQEVAVLLGPAARLLCAEYFDQQPPLFDANRIHQAVVEIAGPVVGLEQAENMAANVIKKIEF